MRRFQLAAVLCVVGSVAVAEWLGTTSVAQDPTQPRRSSRSAFQRRSSPFGSSSNRSEAIRREIERRRAAGLSANAGQSSPAKSAAPAKPADTQDARQVRVEILFVEITALESPKSKLPKLAGKTADVEKALTELKAHGQLKTLERTRMSVLDGRKAMTQIGETKAVASGTTVFGGGGRGGAAGGRFGGARVSRSYSMRSFGSLLSLTPTVEPAGSVVIELQLDKSGPQGEDDSPKESGETTSPPGSRTLTFRNTLRVPADQFVTVTSSTYQTKKGTTRLVVLATAHADALKPAPKR